MLNTVVCKNLEVDGERTLCSVYATRFQDAPWCLSVSKAYENGQLPLDCPYVVDDSDYRGRLEEADYDAEVNMIELGIVDPAAFDFPTKRFL